MSNGEEDTILQVLKFKPSGNPGPSSIAYTRPWRFLNDYKSGMSKVDYKDQLKITLDVTQFRKGDVNVTHDDKFIIVKAEHGADKDKNGIATRELIRKYFIPNDINIESLKTDIDKNGMLIMTANKKSSLVCSPLSEISDTE